MTDRPYGNLPAVAASIMLVATAGTLFVVTVYSPFTVQIAESPQLGFIVRFFKLAGTAVAGAFVGALIVLPVHTALIKRGMTLFPRAVVMGFLSAALLSPLAIVEAIVFHSPPLYWLTLALPAAAFGFFGTLLYKPIKVRPLTSIVLAWAAAFTVVVAVMFSVFFPDS